MIDRHVVRVVEPGIADTDAHALGHGIRFNYEALQSYCWRRLDEVDIDLLVVASGVALADRQITRHRSKQWARDICVELPVHDVAPWEQAEEQLRDCLEWLTGDRWSFRWVRRRSKDERALQLYLPDHGEAPQSVVSYSGGLDSYSEATVRIHNESLPPLLVTTKNQGVGNVPVPAGYGGSSVWLPVKIRSGNHAEPTYRTRQFVFFAAAALACRLRGASRVVIPEPGQGSIGPSVIPFNEHPYRATHPAFTRRLQRLLAEVWGSAPTFDHPSLWRTKAQLLRAATRRAPSDGWVDTRSCSRDVGRHKGLPKGPGTRHCGICGGCLLRRFSLSAAGLADQEQYFWHDLSGPELKSHSDFGGGYTTDTDRQVATYAVLDNTHLAGAALVTDNDGDCRVAAAQLADALELDPSETASRLRQLLGQHRQEWNAFVDELPKTSWVRQLVDV